MHGKKRIVIAALVKSCQLTYTVSGRMNSCKAQNKCRRSSAVIAQRQRRDANLERCHAAFVKEALTMIRICTINT